MDTRSSITVASSGASVGPSASVVAAAAAASRFETFTEAVPLSLSSMAHSNLPLDAGVLDGVKQVLSHTMLSCVNYARIMYPPHQWTFRDLCTSSTAWTAYPGEEKPTDVPFALEKLHFKHQYCRSAFIYLKRPELRHTTEADGKTVTVTEPATFEREIEALQPGPDKNWQHTQLGILGRITLQYISTEALTPGELDGTDVEDIPPVLLYKVAVEYRSLPASGKESPILAEELSMLSFGGSVDDDVKYGALASLYDTVAKYVLEIYSVRGKKYKFDLMDSTLSDGTVPRLPATLEGHPFAKCLCVTVSNHGSTITSNGNGNTAGSIPPALATTGSAVTDDTKVSASTKPASSCCGSGSGDSTKPNEATTDDKTTTSSDITSSTTQQESINGKTKSSSVDDEENPASKKAKTSHDTEIEISKTPAPNTSAYAITRMHLILEGKPRIFGTSSASSVVSQNSVGTISLLVDCLPAFDYMSSCIASSFLSLNPKPPSHVSGNTSGNTLILDPAFAGHIYINGRYITTWNADVRVGSSGVALYGMNLHSIPFWQGRIVDYEVLREAYAQLWHELLVDSKIVHLHLSRSLLYRLMKGKEPKQGQSGQTKPISQSDDDDDDDPENLYDDDDEENDDNEENTTTQQPIDVSVDCLETQVLGASTQYDRVGIAAKALATRFAIEFGDDAYPCLAHETVWARKAIPGRRPIVVPQRLITILRRGGYFNIQQTCDLLWLEETRPIKLTTDSDEHRESEIVSLAIQFLERAECTFADTTNITIVTTSVPYKVITSDAVCRYNEEKEQFYVHEKFFETDLDDLLKSSTKGDEASTEKVSQETELDAVRVKAFLLGMYIAKAHPYGKVLAKYLIRNRP